jgi:hypothetical protein
MAGKHAIEVIDLSELWYVCGGGVDKQTDEAQAAISQATTAVQNLANNLVPKNTGMPEMLMKVLSNRRSGSGPSSAPALPPTSTLTR